MNDIEKISLLSSHITPERFDKMKRAAEMRTRKLSVVMEDIYQPHNAAAVLRTCDAFGIQEVHAIQNRYKLSISYDVDTGASKWLDLIRHVSDFARRPKSGEGMRKMALPESLCAENSRRALSEIRSRGYLLAASTLKDCDASLDEIPVDRPVALMLGTELTGLTDTAEEMADIRFSFPMLGFAQSFNLSVFAAICLANLSKRMRALDDSWKLSDDEKNALLLKWLTKSITGSESLLGSDSDKE